MTKEENLPLTILALAVLIGIVGIVLYYVIPVIGTAIGLIIAVSATGLTTAGAIGVWAVPVASVSVAAIGVSSTIVVIKRVSDSAVEKPYEWGLPLLGAFAGFASTIAKDTGFNDNVSKWIFGGITAFLIVIAGACYRKNGANWKFIAIALYLLPPIVILGMSIFSTSRSTILESLQKISVLTWGGIGTILIIGILIGLLAKYDK